VAVAVDEAVEVAVDEDADEDAVVDVGPAVGPTELGGVCRIVHGVVGSTVEVTPPGATGAFSGEVAGFCFNRYFSVRVAPWQAAWSVLVLSIVIEPLSSFSVPFALMWVA
jgi:hypothetical protein